ncbi:MAG: hypothetical protein JNM56_28515 [Planctomycetia bacterium]|nr:hypothetical protein [Planctomycetia bacterium]
MKRLLVLSLLVLGALHLPGQEPAKPDLDAAFLIKPSEVKRSFVQPDSERRLAFGKHQGEFAAWRSRAKEKLTELLQVGTVKPGTVKELRKTTYQGVVIQALVMEIDANLSIPAYLLVPEKPSEAGSAVIALHGHGEVEPCIGLRDDYHRQFALKLAQGGHLVLCPELRGFGVLTDLAADREGFRLDYWNQQAKRVNDRQFTLVTDGFLHGKTLIGETVEDLLRWEEWLAQQHRVKTVHTAGLSYGGDLALIYPVFSNRVERIFASGTFGSFTPIFARCYNAPAHCIPGVLRWLDRADIAGLNAPRPLVVHFGELDRPDKNNYSASYNETVPVAFQELQKIYEAAGARDRVRLIVSPGKRHEMDNEELSAFLQRK